jgi:hypothetical protein
MSETAAGRRNHLVIWAVAEARRLRQLPPGEDAPVRPATTSAAESHGERRVIADVRDMVVDWQLAREARESPA